VVIGARSAAIVIAALVAAGAASAAAPTRAKGELVIALSMPAQGFQVGSVSGSRVVYARGLEVDLGRALARHLGIRHVRFVQVSAPGQIVRPGRKSWDLALAQIVPTRSSARAVELVGPYLVDDQAVLLRRGLARPRSLADLRRLQLCAVRGSRGADVAAQRARPVSGTLLARDVVELLRWVQTGRCDAAVHEAPALGASVVNARRRYGRLAGRIETGATYAIALPHGSPLAADVGRALAALRADGVVTRLARAWLGFDPARLRALR
jgi:ABC-type amino acid transport substrate-binding protein